METKERKKELSIIRKNARASGKRFELRVRKHLEEKNLVVSKWLNNVDLEKNELISAKNKFRGLNIPMMLGAGFPDFIVFTKYDKDNFMSVITGIECKCNGYLDKIEKAKCKWLLDNHIFSNITIASKGKQRGEIIYKKFEIKEIKE